MEKPEDKSDETPSSDPSAQSVLGRKFVVVLKGSSSVWIPHGTGARFFFGEGSGRAEVRVLTNWVESGFKHPIPRELRIDVRLGASDIDEAIRQALNLASAVIPITAFATNAEIKATQPHLAFEVTPGMTERDFVEYFVPDERGLISQSRAGDPEAIAATLNAVLTSDHSKGIATALSHYHAALGHYHIGGEALAVGHLFMAAEALREPILARYSRETGRTEPEIMSHEGHENRGHLLAWARRTIIFKDDKEVYSAAKNASDGLEHGFRTVREVRALAEPVCDTTFGYVRQALVSLLDLPHSARDALLDRFGAPADTQSLQRRVTGVLVGEADELAESGQDYPILEWNSSVAHFAVKPDGVPEAKYTDHFRVRTSESVSFRPTRMELYGRARPGSAIELLEGQIETPEETRARDQVLPFIAQLAAALAACGPGEQGADFPQHLAHLLELFNRAKGLFRACVSLLRQGLPEESLIVGRALLRDSLRLLEAADSDEDRQKALAFGWRYDSVAAADNALRGWTSSPEAEEERRKGLEKRQAEIRRAARRFGVDAPRSFTSTQRLMDTLDDTDYQNIDQLAEAIEHGWDIATRSRRRSVDGTLGLHDTAPNSWVYPLATKYIGGSCLIAADAAIRLFGWEDPDGLVAASVTALEELEAEFAPSAADGGP